MLNRPTSKELSKLPHYDELSKYLENCLVYMHFFLNGSHWYVIAHDDGILYGFTVLEGMEDCAEWGGTSLEQLDELQIPAYVELRPGTTLCLGYIQVDRDLYWEVCPVLDVEIIRQKMGVE